MPPPYGSPRLNAPSVKRTRPSARLQRAERDRRDVQRAHEPGHGGDDAAVRRGGQAPVPDAPARVSRTVTAAGAPGRIVSVGGCTAAPARVASFSVVVWATESLKPTGSSGPETGAGGSAVDRAAGWAERAGAGALDGQARRVGAGDQRGPQLRRREVGPPAGELAAAAATRAAAIAVPPATAAAGEAGGERGPRRGQLGLGQPAGRRALGAERVDARLGGGVRRRAAADRRRARPSCRAWCPAACPRPRR